jgi:hypothetical protein
MATLFAQLSLPGGVPPKPPTVLDDVRAAMFDLTGLAIPMSALVALVGIVVLAAGWTALQMKAGRPEH